MTAWTTDELAAIGDTDEIQIAPARADGRPGPATTIWVVPVADRLYIRSYRGAFSGWYRRAILSRCGLIRAGGLEREVRLDDVDAELRGRIDEAYRTKYGRYGSSYVDAMVGDDAADTTLRLQLAR
jgi:hypothetical protein